MNAMLIGGIILRVIVCLTAGPFNPDRHFEVIQYTAEHGWPPISNFQSPDGTTYTQSYHPPLYYLLMAPLHALWPTTHFTPEHIASLVISCINLILIRRLLDHPMVVPHRAAQLLAMGFAAFLPQFVMFGSFVSNDTLTMLVGTMIFMATVKYITEPTDRRLIGLAILCGVGLLTKGTFLLTGVAIIPMIALIESRRHRGPALKIALFCLIFAVIGGYKFIENQAYHGRPIVHNLDLGGEIYESQRGTWKGPQSILDFDVTKLIRHPILQTKNTFSYPLLFYGTFWYAHIPESSYVASVFGYAWVGSILYAVAIVPTIVFLMGVWKGVTRVVTIGRSRVQPTDLVRAGATLLLLSNLAVVIAAGIKYDAWSNFQSRLCFQSMLPALVLFGAGMGMIPRKKWLQSSVIAICWATVAAGLLYFAMEVPFSRGWLPRGPALTP